MIFWAVSAIFYATTISLAFFREAFDGMKLENIFPLMEGVLFFLLMGSYVQHGCLSSVSIILDASLFLFGGVIVLCIWFAEDDELSFD